MKISGRFVFSFFIRHIHVMHNKSYYIRALRKIVIKMFLCFYLLADLNEVLDLLQGRGLVLGDRYVVDAEPFHGGQPHLWGEADQVGDPLPHQGLHLGLSPGCRCPRNPGGLQPGEVVRQALPVVLQHLNLLKHLLQRLTD